MEPLKNSYNRKYVKSLATAVQKNYKDFAVAQFTRFIFDSHWEQKELKERMSHICDGLREFLPDSYPKALQIVLDSAPTFGGYEGMYFPQFVERYGREKKHLKKSLAALEQLTAYSSSEFAVRPFIIDDPEMMMDWMFKLSKSSNYHVRRLASEGCRPRLPWAMALPDFKKDPKLILPILENLKADPELYVRKSVANNLNDISKDNPKIANQIARRWHLKKAPDETRWIVNHGLRSLIKAGDPQALKTLGYGGDTNISVVDFQLSPSRLSLGDRLEIQFSLKNKSPKSAPLMVDYVVHFVKSSGKTQPKVFKLKRLELAGKAEQKVRKSHSLKPISTRKYYPGKHHLEIQVNGKVLAKKSFHLSK